jgi:hypothetical protein
MADLGPDVPFPALAGSAGGLKNNLSILNRQAGVTMDGRGGHVDGRVRLVNVACKGTRLLGGLIF